MQLDYFSCRMAFREKAPGTDGYKASYKLIFDTLLEELEVLNAYRPNNVTRTFTPTFEQLQPIIRSGKKNYYEALNWLDKHGFAQYVKGENQNALGYLRMLNLPEIPASSTQVSYRTSTELAWSQHGTYTGTSAEPAPPPHAGAIIDNQIKTGRPAEGGYSVPKNIQLSADEETTLLESFGAEKFTAVLLKVSAFKTKNGALRQSDYANAISWASRQYDADLVKSPKPVQKAVPSQLPANGVPPANRHYKEWL